MRFDEEWRVIPTCTTHAISNIGRIKRLVSYRHYKAGYILSKQVDKHGYCMVKLQGKYVLVHRLVMLAFVGECPEGKQVNHKNGIKTDNRLENLEYVTPRENTQHAINNGLFSLGKKFNQQDGSKRRNSSPRKHGEIWAPNGKLSENDIKLIKSLKGTMTQRDISKKIGVHESTISRVLTGISWKIVN